MPEQAPAPGLSTWLRLPGIWALQGACRTADPEAFFADRDEALIARAVCALCPVVDKCLAWALETGEPHGVWGGLSGRERAQLLLPHAARKREEALGRAALMAAAANRAARVRSTRRPEPAAPAPGRERTIPGLLRKAAAARRSQSPARDSAVRRGETITVSVAPRLPRPGRPDERRPLSAREIQVLAEIARGASYRATSTSLGIALHTVKSHTVHLTTALGARGSSTHAVALGYAYGYFKPEPVPADQRPQPGERQLDVLCLLPLGLSNAEIAKTMFLSEYTVKTHVRNLMKMFAVPTRAALVDRVLHCGLLTVVLDESGPQR